MVMREYTFRAARILAALSVLLVNGCAARLPGTAQEPRVPEGEREVTVAALPNETIGPQSAANNTCDNVKLAIAQQKLWLKKGAVRDKNVALLITTVIGAGGLVATTILANNQSINTMTTPQTTNSTPTTVTGTITAGATALGGVLAAFVVGTGNEDEAALYDSYAAQVSDKQKDMTAACANSGAPTVQSTPPVALGTPAAPSVQSSSACAVKTEDAKLFCNSVARKLRWGVGRPGS